MSSIQPSDFEVERTSRIVQRAFPQIYLACHTRHQRKKSTPHRLSARDSSILAHLDQRVPVSPARLAKHLGVAASTLSEALKRLARLGFVVAPVSSVKARRTSVLLSDLGAQAIRDTSVLETERLEAILRGLTRRELDGVAQGLAGLGDACRRYAESAAARRAATK
jgi:DNA-binding MarR family transcriptional regulator